MADIEALIKSMNKLEAENGVHKKNIETLFEMLDNHAKALAIVLKDYEDRKQPQSGLILPNKN